MSQQNDLQDRPPNLLTQARLLVQWLSLLPPDERTTRLLERARRRYHRRLAIGRVALDRLQKPPKPPRQRMSKPRRLSKAWTAMRIKERSDSTKNQ